MRTNAPPHKLTLTQWVIGDILGAEMEITQLLEKAGDYLSKEKLALVEEAYRFALEAHHGQTRQSGEPYLQHPLEAASILTDLRLDASSLAAALLHDVLEEALRKGGPDIFNTDQGAQFTGESFTRLLQQHEVRISMDGKRRYSDNLFIERLWRTVKYEEVYLKAYQDGRDARAGIGDYFRFYKAERSHQALGYMTPAEVFASIPVEATPGGMIESLTPDTLRTAGPTLNVAPILSK